MQRSRPRYSPKFRQQMVALVRSGRTPESLSREFEPSAQSIRNWVEQSDRDAGLRADGLTSAGDKFPKCRPNRYADPLEPSSVTQTHKETTVF